MKLFISFFILSLSLGCGKIKVEIPNEPPNIICSKNSDCEDFNQCTENICSSNKCEFTNLSYYSACTEDSNKICHSGTCTSRCFMNSACNDENECTNEACTGFYDLGSGYNLTSIVMPQL